MKILNLYAGIGGNRKLWGDAHEITAVENNPVIAEIYGKFFPKDKVIVADAHEYLKEHYSEFDFIWSSPPCPTHSRFNNLKKVQIDNGFHPRFPDMKLYEEIIFLRQYFKGKWVVENVKSYYEPLIQPYIVGNHYIWSNSIITAFPETKRGIRTQSIEMKSRVRGFQLPERLSSSFKKNILNNCVMPELGKHIFNMVFKEHQKKIEETI